MTKEQAVVYLKGQAYWIEYLVQQINKGEEVNCAWTIDLVGLDAILEEINA